MREKTSLRTEGAEGAVAKTAKIAKLFS